MQPNIPPTWFWQRAPFFRLLLPFVAGIVLYDNRALHTGMFLPAGVAAFLLSGLVLLYFFSSGPWTGILRFVLFTALLFVFAWMSCTCYDIRNDAQWFGHRLRADGFAAEVVQAPQEKERTWKLELSVTAAMVGDQAIPVCGRAIAYVYKSDSAIPIRQGHRIWIPAHWQPLSNSGNPYAFDYRRFAGRQNRYYQQFLSADEIMVIPRQYHFTSHLDHMHQWAMRQLERYVPDKATLGLLQAMLLGDEVNFDADQRQRYSDTGIIHVVAISGGHVAFLFLLISLLFFWLRKGRYQWVLYAIAIPLAWFYVMIAGSPASAIRSVVMFSLLGIGVMAGRRSDPLNQLFGTAFIILLFRPFWLFSIGFQLSFTAVLSLVLFYTPVYRIWRPGNRLLRKLWSVTALSIAAEILVAPLVAFYFHSFPLAFIPANICAWLLMGLVMTGGLLIIALSSFAPAASLIAGGITVIVHYFNIVMRALQQWSPAPLQYICLPLPELCIIYLIIAGLSLFLLQRQKKALFFVLSACCVLLGISIYTRWQSAQQQMVTVYNISRVNHIEQVCGDTYTVIRTDTAADRQQHIRFAAREAHVYTHAWHKRHLPAAPDWLQIGKEHMLILDAPVQADSIFPYTADYLVINYPLHAFDAVALRQAFRFKKLILAGNQKRYKLQQWKDSCAKYAIPLHATALDGAFVWNGERVP